MNLAAFFRAVGRRGAQCAQSVERTGLRLAAALILCACVALTSACGKREAVVTVPTEVEANEIIDLLQENGIEAQKEAVGDERSQVWRILVTEDMFGSGKTAVAIQVLRDNGLPRPQGAGVGEDKDDPLIQSPSRDEDRRTRQLANEIERQLQQLPGVIRVDVNVVLAGKDIVALKQNPASASVLIVHRNAEKLFTDEQVRALVIGSVPDLSPENVKVAIYQQTPRPVSQRTSESDSRRKIFIFGVIIIGVLVAAIVTLAAIIWRQRAARMAAEEDAAATQEASELAQAEPRGQLTDGAPRR
jgi:type III secretion protein J